MTLPLWFSLFTATVVISLTPGAGAINTMSNSLSVGWRRSFWGVLGQQFALLLHIAIVAAGVGVLVANTPALFNAIRWLGAAYLVYLGIRLIVATPQPQAETAGAGGASAWALLRRGFWVNLLNPKAIVFFLAFLPQFIRPDQPLAPQYLILTATVVGVDLLVMWGFFASAAKPFRRYAATPRGARTLNSVFGALFIAVAGLLLLVH
ncbi:LysE family transporter [Leucobacter luti]|uniref:Homoserine/homoserine lactone efflux protein n=1 Tax=Leucobacter luti TaxID=340320 RepID=A0A4Q7U108_9MICO|nr:LysE family transporter [Leucobacter luti]MBL3698840.1 lysine transporter LysE [Leucobacter luti]RZT66218.1 homoserine/homoserine lactone efflux protein [Leucobacter luti]